MSDEKQHPKPPEPAPADGEADAEATQADALAPAAGDPGESGEFQALEPSGFGGASSGDPRPPVVAAAGEADETDAQESADEPGEIQALQPTGAADVPAAANDEARAPVPTRAPDEDSLRLAEALIFASADPVSARALQRLLPDDIDAEAVLALLRTRYAGRGVELVDAAGGVMFRSAQDLAPRLRKVIEAPRRLPRVAMETLAIVAYHQPMTRPEIEHIRGAALSQQTLDALLELNLIAPKGRRETPGRPTLWGTTPEFLAHFGLKDLRELPRREDLLLEPAPPRPGTVTPDLQSPAERAPAPAEPSAAGCDSPSE